MRIMLIMRHIFRIRDIVLIMVFVFVLNAISSSIQILKEVIDLNVQDMILIILYVL